MAQVKIIPTAKHRKAIQKAINLYGSRKNVADYLGITLPNVSQWLNGKAIIPLRNTTDLADNKKIPMDFFELRPDMLQYKKYYKAHFKRLQN